MLTEAGHNQVVTYHQRHPRVLPSPQLHLPQPAAEAAPLASTQTDVLDRWTDRHTHGNR